MHSESNWAFNFLSQQKANKTLKFALLVHEKALNRDGIITLSEGNLRLINFDIGIEG